MKKKEYIGIAVVIFFFGLAAYLAREFSESISSQLDFGLWGMLVYVLATILATVVAPLSTVPLIPLAVELWGPFTTSLLNVFSWGFGSLVAFLIARKFGKPYVGRLVNLESIAKYEKALSEEYLFWNILFLRMAIPVDIFSYAVGLFSSIKFRPYMLATIIGISPFAFILSYASQASFHFQILAGILVVSAMYLGYRRIQKSVI